MCGIAAAIALSASASPVDRRTLERMLRAIEGRGPDARGIWIDPHGRIGLANARLSTQDARPEANQPLMDEGRSAVITFNGEIYNHPELRHELEGRGYRFRTRSDTEVVVTAYRADGDALLPRLEGQFAFVLYDLVARRIVMARDPVGVCPLYWTIHDGVLWVASEPRALLQIPGLPRRLNPQALAHYLILDSTPLEETLFEGLRYLRAGNVITFRLFEPPCEWRYADALFAPVGAPDASPEAWAEQFRDLLTDAVGRCLIGEKEVGLFLSGGLDSGSLVALMRRLKPDHTIRSFSVGFQAAEGEPVTGELDEARQMSVWAHTLHEEIVVRPDDLLSRLGQFELPPAGILEAVFDVLAARTADRGVQVILSGEGADETFFGYDHYFAAISRLDPAYAHLAPRYPLRAEGAEQRVGTSRHLLDLFIGGGADVGLEAQRAMVFGPRLQDGATARGVAQRYLDELGAMDPDAELDKQILYLDLCQKLPEGFLRRLERPAMGRGVEVRVPYLDLRLIKLHLQLPMAVRLGTGTLKELLKRSLTGLVPEEVLARPKVPFGLPAVRTSYYPGAGRVFPRPMLATLFSSRFDEAAAAILEGPLLRNELLNADYVRTRLFSQRNPEMAWFDPFLWKLWSLSVWYDRWLEPAPTLAAEHRSWA